MTQEDLRGIACNLISIRRIVVVYEGIESE